MKSFSYITFIVFIVGISYGQSPTIGLTYTSDSVTPGYTLFSYDHGGDIYLINNCGEEINKWSISETPGLTSYLLTDGTILITGKDSLYIKDWDNNTLWSYATTDNGIRQHHDVQPLPNGNILCIATEFKSITEQVASGKDSTLAVDNFKLDKIIELEPVGSNNANVVWEWHFWDHLVQDFDATKLNYGVIASSPELLDINFIGPNTTDWTHVNSIHYNEQFDQILLSARHKDEIYVIDHSTTTLEAAGHTGGNSGKGGDFLYRWGNPQVYQQGTTVDQKLFGQHDAQWVMDGYPYSGMISVFNNNGDGSGTFSSIHIINPDMNGAGYFMTNDVFGPSNFNFSWSGSVTGDIMYSSKKSGVHVLKSGGFLVCEAAHGKIFEIDSIGNVIWVYRNPLGHPTNGIFDQFYPIVPGENSVFRATKYPLEYDGFIGKDLTPIGILEDQNSLSASCYATGLGIAESNNESQIVNPVVDGKIMVSSSCETATLVDQTGKIIGTWDTSSNSIIDISKFESGFYFLKLRTGSNSQSQRLLIIN